jgi:nucleoside-diphosphate-sugar epimerase
MMKRVLITGASGFIGYHLIRAALQAQLEVFAAVRKNSNIQHLKEFNIHYTHLDYTSIENLEKEIEDKEYNYIIHASGVTKAKTQSEYNTINAQYSQNLGKAASQCKVPIEKFVFVSSLAALGPLKMFEEQLQDNSAANPVTSYGASKLLAEQYLAEITELPLIVIRPTAVYGPREKDIFILFKTINKGLEPHIGNFQQQLSFVYVTDLAQIIIKALESPFTHKSYNVSDGLIYNRYALAEGVKKALERKTLKFHLPVTAVNALAATMDLLYLKSKIAPALNKDKMQELTAINWACSINNLMNDMNYSPQYDLEKGLYETIKWYKNNNWL